MWHKKFYSYSCAVKYSLTIYVYYQKRESGSGPLTSTSDKSSGAISNSTPSTPQAGSSNLPTECRLSQSLLTEASPSTQPPSETRQVTEETDFGREIPLVCNSLFLFHSFSSSGMFKQNHAENKYINFQIFNHLRYYHIYLKK